MIPITHVQEAVRRVQFTPAEEALLVEQIKQVNGMIGGNFDGSIVQIKLPATLAPKVLWALIRACRQAGWAALLAPIPSGPSPIARVGRGAPHSQVVGYMLTLTTENAT